MNSPKYKWNNWDEIDWKIVEVAIFKLQKRIYRASQRGDVKLVHSLQRLLTTSNVSTKLTIINYWQNADYILKKKI